MILNNLNNSGTTSANKKMDLVNVTIQEDGNYSLALQSPEGDTKMLLVMIDDASAENFTVSVDGADIKNCNSIDMQGKKSAIKLQSHGDCWCIRGVRNSIINK